MVKVDRYLSFFDRTLANLALINYKQGTFGVPRRLGPLKSIKADAPRESGGIVATGINAPGAKPKSRVVLLVSLLNALLLGWLLYTTFGKSLTAGDGVSVTLINNTPFALVDLSLRYPGGSLDLARVEPNQRIGSPLRNPGVFEATLTFKDEAGHVFQETFPVKPVGEFLINLYILPVWEEAPVPAGEGAEEKAFRPSTSRVRVLPSYQGENLNI
jgi:hypothetical protein